ncbi:hypothetical protein TeGR_g2169 [Tetraparma gracilis]|uniref:Fe2OG dioxygenase domain-containing protein n=1 Tax=Tetraparma gracilis TaxID=2962635 RepID=A0ABQ6N9T1_9STRA|nr:hypothetical protein TeGR_g2169 [Tetraparma gracilis]
MREKFQRDDAVDKMGRDELVSVIDREAQVYDEKEESVVEGAHKKLSVLKEEDFKELGSPDHLVKMQYILKEGSSTGIGRATTIVDAPIAEAAAFELSEMSREVVKVHFASGGLDRELLKINDHQSIFHLVIDLAIPGFKPRQWVQMLVWRWSADKKELTTISSSVEHDGFPECDEYLRASCTVVTKYKQEAEVGGIPQTKVTYTMNVDVGGAIPKWVINTQAVETLMYLSAMRKRFDKSLEIDAASQGNLVTMIQNHDGEYSEREEEILEEGKTMIGVFEQQKSKELKMSPSTTQAKMAYKDGESHAYGWSSAVVRASPAQVLALVWDTVGRFNDYEDTLEKTLDEDGEHSKLMYIKKKVPNPFDNRDFLTRMVWKKRGAGFIYVSVPELSGAHPLSSDIVRANYPSMLKMACTSDGSTQLEFVLQPDAVNEWIERYPATKELEREYVWFRPMMDTVAQRLLESVSWGIKMRLYVGATLSTMDLISDVYMIYTYATTGQQGTALSLAAMVGLCLLLQLFLVWVQTHKGPRRVMLKEMLIVLTGIAPGIHAMRVANGNEKLEHAKVSPQIELATTRGFELVCESIPGTVVQLAALFRGMQENGGDYSKAALASIVVSACTTGFVAATISFDFDVDPERRRNEPKFYGYIPDSAGRRTAIFFCMIMNGALLLLLRGASTALLVMVDGRLVLYCYLGDHALYLAYKIARRDLYHWVPLEGVTMVVESVIERVCIKAITDFTGVAQFRAMGEMGGIAQWFADLGMGWAGPRRWRRSCYRLRNDIGTEIDPILHLRSLIQAVTPASAPELCETYNSVLVNRYSSGAAGIKWHADDERWYCVHERDNKCDIRIASVSLGAERFFEMRRRPQGNPDERRKLRIRLRSGSLLVMAGPCQEHWQHALPRDDECEGVRYNLTFRRVLTAEEDPTLRTVRAD